ncbi:uncharacterized protein LOC109613909 [Musca domestica]|uniref:Uncharacterized protein LOC109613909 n=1 Tax=Musca domestica TaxID=7370 RepID=A0ABM3UZF6_MUSDO|nr:uncharacterized protein LOC109613909 [Musca domestica]
MGTKFSLEASMPNLVTIGSRISIPPIYVLHPIKILYWLYNPSNSTNVKNLSASYSLDCSPQMARQLLINTNGKKDQTKPPFNCNYIKYTIGDLNMGKYSLSVHRKKPLPKLRRIFNSPSVVKCFARSYYLNTAGPYF